MKPIILTDVTPDEFHELECALRALASDLSDPFRIDSEDLKKALFGPNPACYGILAKTTDEELVGAAMFAPLVSTAFGASGAYVSDLWVAETARGQKTGKALLAKVAKRAEAMWNAGFVRLMVYEANTDARRFYERLEFQPRDGEILLTIASDKLI